MLSPRSLHDESLVRAFGQAAASLGEPRRRDRPRSRGDGDRRPPHPSFRAGSDTGAASDRRRLEKVEQGRYIAAHTPGARSSNSREKTTSTRSTISSPTSRRSSSRSASSRRSSTASSRRCCSRTSSTPRCRRPRSVTRGWHDVRRRHDADRPIADRAGTEDARSRRWATGSSRRSTARSRSAVRHGDRRRGRSARASRSVRGCTPARSRSRVTDVAGLGVAIGARVGALAGPSEVLVSQTVKDLVAGCGLTFEDAGEHELKGVPDTWRLYRVIA